MIAGTTTLGIVSFEEEAELYLEIDFELDIAWDIFLITCQGLRIENPLETALCFCKFTKTEYVDQSSENIGEYAGLLYLKNNIEMQKNMAL